MDKILLITYYWPPSGGAGVQRPLKFAKYWSKAGIQVYVLTVDPSTASYPVTDNSLAADVDDKISVHYASYISPLNILSLFVSKKKIPFGGFSNTGESAFQKVLRFVRGNIFIPDARVGWVRKAYKQAVEIISKNKINSVIISSPPHSSQLIGLKLKKRFPHIKWIADLRDPWTDIYYYKELLHTVSAKRIDARYERKVLEACDAALVVSPSIRETFLKKSDTVGQQKIHIIPNGYDDDDFTSEKISEDKDVFVISYVGTMADSYSPDVFFKVLKEITESHPDYRITVQITGSISKGILRAIKASGISNLVKLIPYVPHNQAVKQMKGSSLQLLIIPDVEDANGILTGKLFEYMGAGKPILGIGPPQGDAASILNKTGSGKIFSRTNNGGIKTFIETILSDWKNGIEFIPDNKAIREFSRQSQADVVATIFKKLQTS